MLKKRIIPCLDVKDGRVVKGINFVNLTDAGDPVEQAIIYDKNGADEICFLDITASNEKRNILLETVKKTAQNISIPLTVGGGVRSLEDINKLLNNGADKVSIHTAAVVIKNFGVSRIVYTDINKDGTKKGPNIKDTVELSSKVKIPLVISGGVSSIEDIKKIESLNNSNIEGVIVGKSIYDGDIKISDLAELI